MELRTLHYFTVVGQELDITGAAGFPAGQEP